MINMKQNIIKWLSMLPMALLLTGCYEDYVVDYKESAVSAAYQYDLRTFVVGEGMKFDFTVGLSGVIENKSDRKVKVVIDDALVNGDLSGLAAEGKTVASFTAMQGMLGKAPFGSLSSSYVTDDVRAAGISALTPLPEAYYVKPATESMKIKSGRHTDAVTIKAVPEKILADANAFKPYYALGFRIESADADVVPSERSYAVIAVRCENKFYGNWYHGGKTVTYNELTGDKITEEVYPLTIPETNNSRLYVLSTVDGETVTTNRFANGKGSLTLHFNDDGKIDVTDATGAREVEPLDGGSRFNGAKLLQDRKLYLHYKLNNGDGTVVFVRDTLVFRNRVRDGINEWQDENPENYN